PLSPQPHAGCIDTAFEIAEDPCRARLTRRSVPIFKVGSPQGFLTGEWGSGVSSHRSNPEPLMSALGQKRTFSDVRRMSALPPKADIARLIRSPHQRWQAASVGRQGRTPPPSEIGALWSAHLLRGVESRCELRGQ